MPNVNRWINIGDVEEAARRRLPRPVFDAIAGGAAAEWTLRANRIAFDKWHFRPRVLVDNRRRDLSTTALGERISMPLLIAPMGSQRIAHRHGELAMARAAGQAGTGFALSSYTSYPLEEVASQTSGPRWFQFYMPQGDRSSAKTLLARARAAGYKTLCVTVDTSMHAIRERDVRNRLTRPLKLHPRMLLACATKPRWTIDFLLGGVGRQLAPSKKMPMSMKEAGQVLARLGRTMTYDDLAWLRSNWEGPLLVKGVLRGDDCTSMLEHGVDGFVISNHGGRQLDGTPPTIDVLLEVKSAVGTSAELYIDSGFRRGTDVLKALALGARGVMIGRPAMYGLAVGGQAGVERVLDIFRYELETAIGLLGCPSVEELDASFLSLPEGGARTGPALGSP